MNMLNLSNYFNQKEFLRFLKVLLIVILLHLKRTRIIYQYLKNDYYSVSKALEYIKMSDKIMYIWYCPRSSCNAIVLKTNKPILSKNKEYQCKRCLVCHTSESLVIANKRNIQKYLNSIDIKRI